MRLNDVIFLNNYPSLDLHGYDRDSARVLTNDFIHDNKIMGNEIVVIIHGKGEGIVKEEVHKTLSKNKDVLEYKIFNYNDGCTLVKIKIE